VGRASYRSSTDPVLTCSDMLPAGVPRGKRSSSRTCINDPSTGPAHDGGPASCTGWLQSPTRRCAHPGSARSQWTQGPRGPQSEACLPSMSMPSRSIRSTPSLADAVLPTFLPLERCVQGGPLDNVIQAPPRGGVPDDEETRTLPPRLDIAKEPRDTLCGLPPALT
jgi:hypothetical protein